MEVSGFTEFAAALQRKAQRTVDLTQAAAKDSADLISAATVAKLSEKSHPPHTKTPSAPGEPPAMISGDLAASMRVGSITRDGNTFEIEVGPTEVYSRIQELGGTAGRGAQLPARPYLAPAFEESLPGVAAIIRDAWADV